ncbi:MAG: PqqD family protein [Lentisphaeria bacterium]|nr:PqqD family protein [Lentisphaeria bacterium]
MVPPVSWIVPFRAEREITLDAVGRLIWEWCDGRCTVEDITERFRDRYRLTFHEARAAVTGYLQLLIRHGLVAIVMQEKP